jgi:hypothetical protein
MRRPAAGKQLACGAGHEATTRKYHLSFPPWPARFWPALIWPQDTEPPARRKAERVSRSAGVDFPWLVWAMMAKLRM